MWTFYDRPYRLCDGLSRRDWLRLGTLGLVSAAATRTATAQAPTDPTFGRARSCIVLFLTGGPPQHDTWDPKPQAPVEIRGALKPISTSVPGIAVGELMPLLAQRIQHLCIVRSMSSADNAHSSSGYWMLTGAPHVPMNMENARVGPPNDAPSLGALVEHFRAGTGRLLPTSITLPEHIWNTGGISWPGQDGGWLGRHADPWLLTCDPSATDFQLPGASLPSGVSAQRFLERRTLLAEVERRIALAETAGPERWDQLSRQTFELMSAPEARAAFRIQDEPEAVRDRYGRHRFGQSVLLARRLVEAQVPFIQVNWTRAKDDHDENPLWDTHTKNEERLRTALMPPMDQTISALLDDLLARGLLEQTLVAVVAEFGRSPKINPLAGRDHWGYVWSIALAGGGVRGGQVFGSSDRDGGQPATDRVQPWDLSATLLHLLGHDPRTELHDSLGRPLPASRGRVLSEILA